jgi:8-oxo-dGTP diphosphatase
MTTTHIPDKKMRCIQVVAALIRKEGRVLVTQRKPGRHLGLSWEFPGGKVEEGESDHEALARELREELGIHVEITTKCFETKHRYGNREMHLTVYRCSIVSGEPKALDVNAVEWAPEDELHKRNFLPADRPLVDGIVSGLVATEVDDEIDEEVSEEGFPVQQAQVVRPPPAKSST